MSLNWIVPGRRAVLTARMSYESALGAWIAALREDALRDALLRWYGPLSSLPSPEMGDQYDEIVSRMESWAGRFFANQGEATQHAHAPGARATIDHHGWWLRLWKGPYRVLKEHAADLGVDPDDVGAVPTELREIDAAGPLKLRQDVHRRVRNPDAEFVPGDVIEFPVFALMGLCGVRAFRGAHFDGRGSCFLGTSVVRGGGGRPQPLPLHDNLIAMRFQLLLNAARGAFYSLTPGYKEGASNLDKSNNQEVEDETVYARGLVYAGSLGSITRRVASDPESTSPRDPTPAYVIADNQWGMPNGKNTPITDSLNQYRTNTRLTPGWTCTPCALTLATFMCLNEGSWGGHGVNHNLRKPTAPAALLDNGTLHYFHSRMFATHQVSREDTLRFVYERSGATGTPDIQHLRERSLERLLGDRARRQISEAEHAAATDRILEEEHDEHDEHEEEGACAPSAEDAPAPAELDLHFDPDATEQEDGDDIVETSLPDDDPEDEEIHWDLVLPEGEELELTRDELLNFFDAPISAIGLNGHEYSYVRIYKHDRLLQEPARPAAEGDHGGPPCAGFIAAYNPLNGQPYYAADDDRGDFFIFEGTGRIMPLNVHGYRGTAFEVRPSRWQRVEQVYISTDSRGRLKIGEGAAVGLTGRVHTRSKHLISVVTFSEEKLRALHDRRRIHRRVSFQAHARSTLEAKSRDHDYPDRAVPYPTLDESSEDTQWATIEQAHARRIAVRQGFPNRAQVSEAQQAAPNFERRVTNRTRQLRAGVDARIRRARNVARRLRRQLERRYPPHPAMPGLPVEQRPAFLIKVRELEQERGPLRARLREASEAYDAAAATRREAVGRAAWDEVRQATAARRDAAIARGRARRALDRASNGRELSLAEAVHTLQRAEAAHHSDSSWRRRAIADLIKEQWDRVKNIRAKLAG